MVCWFILAVFVYGVAWMSSSSSSLVLVGDVCVKLLRERFGICECSNRVVYIS